MTVQSSNIAALDKKIISYSPESGNCTAWNGTITEQYCTKYGNICLIHVRGTVNSMSPFLSLFSLPWNPVGLYGSSDFGNLKAWKTGEDRPKEIFSAYNINYNLVTVGDASYNYDNYCFDMVFLSI